MKKLFIVFIVMCLFAFSISFVKKAEGYNEKWWWDRQNSIFLSDLHYIYDARTGICFVYYSQTNSSMFSFTDVPCENVK